MQFYFTFGQQYSYTEHPKLKPEYAHPDGWVTVEAPDELAARLWFAKNFTNAWSSTYVGDDFFGSYDYYPRGELAKFTVDSPAHEQLDCLRESVAGAPSENPV